MRISTHHYDRARSRWITWRAELGGVFLAAFLLAPVVSAQTNAEFRAFWADAFHDGFKTPAQVTKLVADTRAANCNAIVIQVRKRGDAYYESNYEPKATDISPTFDPLQDLINKAHDTNGGPRLEVHAWVVAYTLWNMKNTLPPQANHPYRLHPDWVTQDNTGETWNGTNYELDPSHPEVQQHLFNVAMDIVSRYDVDGLNWDHIRYEDNAWGYHPLAVARFRARYGGSGAPAPTDPAWLQFRRDQVTALVRKSYLGGIALKPWIKMSTCCNTRAPGITTTAEWPTSASYRSTLQDWRAWLEEGIVDMATPMTYFVASSWGSAWAKWTTFQKDHRYNRQVVVGPGIYLNTVSNSLYQLHNARTPSPSGNYLDGICMYSYAATSSDNVSAATFRNALVAPSAYDPNPVPVFATPVSPPVMPWKANPTQGHLKGFVYSGPSGAPLDGAVLRLTGPQSRTLTNDGTGFYGAVDLPPGNYLVSAEFAGYGRLTNAVTITAGQVATLDFTLGSHTLRFHSSSLATNQFHSTLSGHGTDAIVVFASTNFVGWRPIRVLPPTNSLLPFCDPDAGSFPQRYYRAGAGPLQTLADFEAYAAGTSVMFRDPAFSGSTSSHLDTNPGIANFTRVTNNFPAGHASARVLQASWTFKSGTANPWLRLTTSSAPNLPNPVIGFNQVLRFDLYTDRDLYVAIGLRETNTGAPIGGNGGASGDIEWVGGTTNNSISPPRGRLVTAGQWTTLEFFIPYEPVRASTGNGLLESTTGKGVLEQLTLVPADGVGAHNLYLDNFQVLDLE